MGELPVIIAGGGIAGLAAAAALARTGREVIVCERAAAFETAGAGLQVSPNAVSALKALGAWEMFEPATYAPPAILIRDGLTGKVLKRVALGQAFADRFGEPYRVAHRADLHQALQSTAGAHDGVTFKTGSAITGYRNEQGVAFAYTSGGSEVAAEAVIGADGLHSAVRRQMLGDGPARDTGATIYRALIAVPPLPDMDCVNLWMAPGAHAVHYPVDGGARLNVVAAVESAGSGDAFAGCHDTLLAILGLVPAWGGWPAADRPAAPRWHDGRVLLIGDAAHPTLPYLAQGAAMALEDAQLLGALIGEGPIEDVIAQFCGARRARTTRVMVESRAQGARYHWHGASRSVRNAVLSLVPQSIFLSRLAWLYDGA